MTALLVDTMILAWAIDPDAVDMPLSASDRDLLDTASERFVSPISLFEIATKARIGRWPLMVPHVERLVDMTREIGFDLALLDARTLLDAAMLDWDHRDPFDRIVVATAKQMGARILTTDRIIERYAGGGAAGR